MKVAGLTLPGKKGKERFALLFSVSLRRPDFLKF